MRQKILITLGLLLVAGLGAMAAYFAAVFFAVNPDRINATNQGTSQGFKAGSSEVVSRSVTARRNAANDALSSVRTSGWSITETVTITQTQTVQ